jgi:uncharacterized membrane protein YsdA (DUF1294 family)
MNSLHYIIIYFLIVNIMGFALMGSDKRRAKKGAFRIPEATLFSVAIIGGSIGSILGMLIFRHKTKHWYFKFGLPAILVLQLLFLAVMVWLPVSFSFI